ncbi:hypothetical protein F183_A54340 [Bryobacterales bacterium F-183]|nr:hypothetical protein F183_A54340 [Bryobacterales bacterium F-183]
MQLFVDPAVQADFGGMVEVGGLCSKRKPLHRVVDLPIPDFESGRTRCRSRVQKGSRESEAERRSGRHSRPNLYERGWG